MENLKIINISFKQYTNKNELLPKDLKLVNEANQALLNAHAPYSAFQVGAAIELEDGQIVTGSNQENAAYPSGLCAERVAIFYASAQYPNKLIKTIAVTAKSAKSEIDKNVSPCGACRQVIAEFEKKQKSPIKIIFMGPSNSYLSCDGIAQLLPLAFE